MERDGDELTTERLLVRPIEESDLEMVLAVYESNPAYLLLTEGSSGDPGRYDLEMLQRDVAVALVTPGRHFVALEDRRTGELLGVLDWIEANPSDGMLWIGLLLVRADRQREGFATEAFEGLKARLRATGVAAVRAGVIEKNLAGMGFVRSLGFRPVTRKTVRMASEEIVLVVERSL